MRSLIALLVVVVVVASCGPSASQLRTQNIQTARMEASQRPGARQARELAQAIRIAYNEGDYKANPQALVADATFAIETIDRAAPNAGIDAPILIGWKGLLLLDLQRYQEGFATLKESFALGPNLLAGRNLIEIYGGGNKTQDVAQTCNATVAVVNDTDDRLSLIALCRKNMNAASPEGEMAWMSPELVTWYQAENARRLSAEIDAANAQAERDRQERQVVRQTEQCALGCKERGLRCQNRCHGDQECDRRCVEINHACVDRCESQAYEALDQ